ncbi:PspC domain-containing protein [Paenibacillus chitinolyticus]|uniref:PspC domain-containing protein n=2 Tax=Paenibacillus chitinolyticus TaxID=79263 RepID=UPI00366E228C
MMNKLFRSRTDRKLTGLCGGLAQYLNVDATIVRLIAVIGAVFSFGTFTLIYIIASLFVPKEPFGGYGYHDSYHSY